MPFLLYHSRSRPTGKALAAALGLQSGKEFGVGLKSLIRWGNYGGSSVGQELNNRSALIKASDKLNAFKIMRQAGVTVPQFSTTTNLPYPFLGRNTDHTQGKDVVLCLQRKDFEINPRDYYVQYIPKVREFRVHVFKGDPFIIQVKHLVSAEEHRIAPHVWNHGNGYIFVTPSLKPKASRLDEAVKAVAALGLDFGAVDMIVGEDDQTYILEVNTAPGLATKSARAYCDKFAAEFSLSMPNYTALAVLGKEE